MLRRFVVIVLLAIGPLALLHACWNADFYYTDDPSHVLTAAEEPVSRLIQPRRFNCFPLTLLSYKADYLLAGPEHPRDAMRHKQARSWATEIRLLNGVYHFLAGLLLYLFLVRLGTGTTLALVVSFAWVAHPAACESVCWVAERKNVLAGLFGFAALLAWTIDRRRWWRWPAVCALYALALASKASALGLFPVLLSLEIIDPIEREFEASKRQSWLKLIARLAVPLLLTIAGAMYAGYAFKYEVVDPPGGSAWTAILSDVVIFGRYAQHILVPYGLSFYYSVEPVTSLADGRLWIGGLTLGLTLFVLWKLAAPGQRRLASFGIAWFLLALAPNANLVASAFPMQDRFMYMAAPGLLLALFLALNGIAERWPVTLKMVRLALLCLPLTYAGLAAARSPLFSSNEALDLDAAQQQPDSAYAQLSAGRRAASSGISFSQEGEDAADPAKLTERATAALDHYQLALTRRDPDLSYFTNPFEIRVRKAELETMLSRYPEARAELDGRLPPPQMNLLKPGEMHTCQEGYRGYSAGLLAHAWAVCAESYLRESSLAAEHAGSGQGPVSERSGCCPQLPRSRARL